MKFPRLNTERHAAPSTTWLAPPTATSLAWLCLITATVFAPNAVAAGGVTERGGVLFAEKCAMCHRVMGMGTVLLTRRRDPATAPLEKRTDLTPEFVVAAARAGLGNMPRISRGEVSDADLATIAAWLATPAAAPTPTPVPPAAN